MTNVTKIPKKSMRRVSNEQMIHYYVTVHTCILHTILKHTRLAHSKCRIFMMMILTDAYNFVNGCSTVLIYQLCSVMNILFEWHSKPAQSASLTIWLGVRRAIITPTILSWFELESGGNKSLTFTFSLNIRI